MASPTNDDRTDGMQAQGGNTKVNRRWTTKLMEALEQAFRYVEMPGKLLTYFATLYLITTALLYSLFAWLPIWSIYTCCFVFAVVGGAFVIVGFMRLPSSRWWIPVLLLIISAGCTFVSARLIPDNIEWTRVDPVTLVKQEESLPPPLNSIESEVWGTQYPGGTSFQKRVQDWREEGGYGQTYIYTSNKVTPNRLPRFIALQADISDAVIGVYLFSDQTVAHKIGFDDRYQRVELPAPHFGCEYFVVVFVFPLAQGTADKLGDNADEILTY